MLKSSPRSPTAGRHGELCDYGIVGFTHIGITDTAAHRFNIFSPDWKNDKINEYNLSSRMVTLCRHPASSKVPRAEPAVAGATRHSPASHRPN